MSLDAAKVINVTPRYARLRADSNGSAKGQIIGWENIELISDRPLEIMLKEFKQLKEEYPDRILIASIMEEYNKAAWEELIDRVEQTGVVRLDYNHFPMLNTNNRFISSNVCVSFDRMRLKSISHALMACPNGEWVLQLGKIVHFWKKFVDGLMQKLQYLFGQK